MALNVVYALVMMAISFVVQMALAKKPEEIETEERGHLLNTKSSAQPVPLLYGESRMGVNIVYQDTSGTDNKYLHIVGNVCEGPVEGLVQVDGVDQIWLDDKLWNEYKSANGSSLVTYKFYTGTSTQLPDPDLNAAIPEWNDAKRYTAYLYIRLQFDRDVFQGVPKITMLVQGLQVYDPATTLTAYSTNPALITRDLLTRSSRRGGMGISTSRIDDTSVSEAATYCDTVGWTCNLPLNDNNAVIDNLREILNTYRGSVIFSQNKFKLRYRDLNYESSVMDLDENDVMEIGGESTLEIELPSLFDTPNAVKVKWINPEKMWQEDELPLSDVDAITADGDRREETIDLRGINTMGKAGAMGYYFLEKLRKNKVASLSASPRCMALEPLDPITLTHRVPGWSSKAMRVESVSLDGAGGVGLSLSEDDLDFYNDTYDLAGHNWHDTLLPSPMDAVPSVRAVSHSEELYYYRDRSFTRWLINFSLPDPAVYPWADYAEIWLKIDDGDWRYMTKSEGGYMVDPVKEGSTYQCKMVVVSIHGRREPFASAYSVSRYMLGKQALPADLAPISGLVNGDTVTIFGVALKEADIAGYEVRLGAAWAGAVLFGFQSSPMIRLVGVKPGTFTFWVAAKDNAGHYSEHPRSATVEVLYPPGYTQLKSWAWNFSNGSFVNTEQATYSGNTVLKCSHTGGVLTGTWTSPEYDLAAAINIRCWGDFITDFVSSTATWGGICPSPMTWTDISATTVTWAELLSGSAPGQISATIKWGLVSGSLNSEASFFEILSAEFTARYVQVVVTITDPTLDANLYLRTLNMVGAYW